MKAIFNVSAYNLNRPEAWLQKALVTKLLSGYWNWMQTDTQPNTLKLPDVKHGMEADVYGHFLVWCVQQPKWSTYLCQLIRSISHSQKQIPFFDINRLVVCCITQREVICVCNNFHLLFLPSGFIVQIHIAPSPAKYFSNYY